jgi:hypothetical protein
MDIKETDMSNAMKKLQDLKQQFSQTIFPSPGSAARLNPNHYLGVGIGHKNGDRNADLAVRIYVRRKRDRSQVAPSEFIDPVKDGCTTDVVEVRRFSGYASPSEPASIGSAVQFQSAQFQGPMGTLAAVLLGPGGRQFGLGSNHVLSRNGSVNNQPGASIVDTAEPRSVVIQPLTLATSAQRAPQAVPLQNGCQVDCAVFEPADGVNLQQTLPSPPVRLTNEPGDLVVGSPVQKFGFSTDWTTGVVADHSNINIDFGPGLGVISMTDIFLVRDENEHDGIASFASPGDSGALVFQQAGDYWSPCGMVVGGPVADPNLSDKTEEYILVCGLKPALQQLSRVVYPDQPEQAQLSLASFA